MGIIHSAVSFAKSGLAGIQACQRDWSSYLVHFTTAKKMMDLKRYPQENISLVDLATKLEKVDLESFYVVKQI